MSEALFVDLPNFYSSLLESRIDDPRLLRDYFLEWFDFDRLSERLTGENSPFGSSTQVGGSVLSRIGSSLPT